MALVGGVRVYPPAHPYLQSVVERLLAGLLAEPATDAMALRQALVTQGVSTIEVDVLELARLHDTFREAGQAAPHEAGERRTRAWNWLVEGPSTPQEIAAAIGAESFWARGRPEGDPEETASLAQALVGLGGRLRDALDALPPERRAEVEGRLARLGGSCAPRTWP